MQKAVLYLFIFWHPSLCYNMLAHRMSDWSVLFCLSMYVFGYSFCSQSIQTYVFGIFHQVSGACQTAMRDEKSYTGWDTLNAKIYSAISTQSIVLIQNNTSMSWHMFQILGHQFSNCLLWPWYLFTLVSCWGWSHIFPIKQLSYSLFSITFVVPKAYNSF